MADRAPALVLNVDDYDPGRHARTRMLRTAGFDVAEAATGTQALELAFGLSPAVVVLDVNLPDMSGFEVCRRLKTAPATRDTAVLHVSATHVQPSDQAAGINGGADGYLTEPVAPDVLVATVNALVRARRVQEALAAPVRRLDAAATAETKLAALVWDLREPVSTIVGWTRALCGALRDPASVEQGLHAIERNALALSDRLDGAVARAAQPAAPLVGVHVLVVEDEIDTRDLLVLVLEHAGARVTAAVSVTEALAVLTRSRADVIIADITLPGEDGYALMRRVRALPDVDVRAIALTGWVRPEDEAAARAAGYDAHLRKPADPGDLVALVQKLVTSG